MLNLNLNNENTNCNTYFFGANILSAQEYSIYGKIEGLEDGEVLLGYYYGDKQFVKDTVESNHGFFILNLMKILIKECISYCFQTNNFSNHHQRKSSF